jgi:carbonic anhydrase
MSFCTAINCIDGRTQLPVIAYLQNHFVVKYVDSITEAGPNRILAEEPNGTAARSIFERLNISIDRHNSIGIAVVGHHDCAGNPSSAEEQTAHTKKAVLHLKEHYKNIEIIGLWVDKNWNVQEISSQ